MEYSVVRVLIRVCLRWDDLRERLCLGVWNYLLALQEPVSVLCEEDRRHEALG
jgi:hypothetical protein